MAGLGNAPQPQQQQPEQGYTSAAAQFDESAVQAEEASPEEQAQFEQFERAMIGFVYPEDMRGKVNPNVLENLRGQFDPSALEMFAEAQPALTDSPQDSLAATAVLLTLLIEQSSGEKFTDDVVMHGGKGAIEELIEVSEAAKIHEYSEQDIETVTYRAVDLYRISSPRVDRDALTAEFGKLAEANKHGDMGSVLPGLPGGAPMKRGAQ